MQTWTPWVWHWVRDGPHGSCSYISCVRLHLSGQRALLKRALEVAKTDFAVSRVRVACHVWGCSVGVLYLLRRQSWLQELLRSLPQDLTSSSSKPLRGNLPRCLFHICLHSTCMFIHSRCVCHRLTSTLPGFLTRRSHGLKTCQQSCGPKGK